MFQQMKCVFFVLFISLTSITAHAGVNDAVIAEFKAAVSGNNRTQRIKVMRRLYEHAGITSEELYDAINERLQRELPNISEKDSPLTDELGWMVKALASSGDKKYLDTLKNIANTTQNLRLRRHAKLAGERFDEFAKWNVAFKDVPYISGKNSEPRIQAYIELLNSNDDVVHREIMRKLYSYSGITDARLFDKIEALMLADVYNGTLEDHNIDLLAWYMKALSSSGNTQYFQPLDKVASSDLAKKFSKLRKYVRKAKEDTKVFGKWNAVLANTTNQKEGRTDQVANWLDLIDSDDQRMATYAIRQAYGYDEYDIDLVMRVSQKLQENYKTRTSNSQALDFQAWACKYLVKSEIPMAIDLVRLITKESPNGKVVKYGKNALENVNLTK